MDLAEIVTATKARNYTTPQTLAVLTMALDENWTAIPDGFFTALESLPHPTADPWYNLAQLRRVGSGDWQAFKMRLYRNLPQALPFTLGTEDLLSALSDDEQRELLAGVRYIRDQLGPTLPGWPSLGLNAKGQELTWRDAFGVAKADVAAIKKKLLG